jgi:uncharacterized protein (UPF0335 family)
MPSPIDETVKRRVVQQWLSGEAREKIAEDNNIGAGTVASIVGNYKIGLDNLDFASFRELMLEAKKRGMTPSDLASHFRLFNYLVKSGAAEQEVESFITNVNSGYIPLGKAIELVNQIHEISKSQSVPHDQLSNYIEKKLVEKKRIDEEIKQADAILQSKNVTIEAINQHIQLNKELKKYRLSTKDIHRLLDVLLAAKKYRYSPGKIVAKLRSIKRLENKENKLKDNIDSLSKKDARYKEIIPFTEELVALHVGIPELMGLEVAIKEAARMYNLSFFHTTVRLINDIKAYNKMGGLKKELERLSLQKYGLSEACSSYNQALITLAKLQSLGITEDRMLRMNNFLESNGYQASTYTNTK